MISELSRIGGRSRDRLHLEEHERGRRRLLSFVAAIAISFFILLGVSLAQRTKIDEVSPPIEDLREKLGRQTGMYRYAGSISDEGAQKLIQKVCGPAHNCAKKILWKLDPETPLDDSEASRFNGIPVNVPEQKAIPLVCREACNHFVAECRKAAKAEFDAKAAATTPG